MTMFKGNRYPAQTLQYSAVAAQAADLIQSVLTTRLRCRLTGLLAIAAGGGGVGVLTPEAALRIIRWIRVTENGTPTMEWDIRALIAMQNREHEHAANIVFPTADVVQGATPFEVDFSLDFASRLLANAFETVYRPVDQTKKFQLEVEWEADPFTQMVTGSTHVWTFSAVQLEVEQHFDAVSGQLPIYVPRLRRIQSGIISGAQADFEFDLKMSTRSRGLLIHMLGDNLTNGGIITGNLSLEGKSVYYKRLDPVMMFEEEQALYPGITRQPGYLFINFAQNGRLSNCFDPAQDGQLKLKADVATGGAASAVLRVYDLQLVGIAGVTRVLAANHALR